jgi:uncharacterized protein
MSATHYSDTLPGGKHWSMIMRKGTLLRLTDVEGGANAGMLFYNPTNLTERYNAPDTLKCQHTFKLTAGHCLYSDMGRVFCAITNDSFGWHDTVCGSSTKRSVASKWGEANFQTHRNGRSQNGLDSFLVEAAKYGMQRRDLAANVNWFSRISVAEDGGLTFDASAEKAGARVDLSFMMDTLVLMHTCPHPLNPAQVYPAKPIRFETMTVPGEPDLARHLNRPENVRGLENNRLYHACGCC